jgi:predicted DNA-binding transcriptional regulator AlpA
MFKPMGAHHMSAESSSGSTVAKFALSINEFCASHGISRSFFYKLTQSGQGPRVIKIGTRSLITVEAAADWRRAHTSDAA